MSSPYPPIVWPRPWPTDPRDRAKQPRLIENPHPRVLCSDDPWWTTAEIEVQNDVDSYYASGDFPLYTAEWLRDAERQMADGAYDTVQVPQFHKPGTAPLVTVDKFKQREPCDDKRNNITSIHPLVECQGHRNLTRPWASWREETAYCPWLPHYMSKPLELRPRNYFFRQREFKEYIEEYDKHYGVLRKRVRKLLGETFDIPADVDKIICFGLGRFPTSGALIGDRADTWWERLDEDNLDENGLLINQVQPNKWQGFGFQYQHIFALEMRDILQQRFGKKIAIYSQEPAYTQADKRLLDTYDIQIIGEHGAEGFAMIDERNIVWSWFCEADTRQIIAEMTRPALIVINQRFEGPPNPPAQIKRLDYEMPDGFLEIYESAKWNELYPIRQRHVVDSPRVIEMGRDYNYDHIKAWEFLTRKNPLPPRP